MKPEFWHEKWNRRETGFNQAEPNSLLVKHFPSLELPQGSRVFLPLCGKTIDFCWLLEQGCQVAGAELSEIAVREFFEERALEPEVRKLESLKRYSAKGIHIFVGDIFDLTHHELGPVDAVYDRAAMVALPRKTRSKYAAHLMKTTSAAPQLVVTFQYDQSQMDGPPFSIVTEELEEYYGATYHIKELESRSVEGKLKGQVESLETIRLLTRLL